MKFSAGILVFCGTFLHACVLFVCFACVFFYYIYIFFQVLKPLE